MSIKIETTVNIDQTMTDLLTFIDDLKVQINTNYSTENNTAGVGSTSEMLELVDLRIQTKIIIRKMLRIDPTLDAVIQRHYNKSSK